MLNGCWLGYKHLKVDRCPKSPEPSFILKHSVMDEQMLARGKGSKDHQEMSTLAVSS